ncbi:MAG: peptidoglycan DD-metalloendopeptidase family protein [Bacillota bacterium]|jgi:murein DD-endopeptidase MepM/ murein hydrolase activator NlpD
MSSEKDSNFESDSKREFSVKTGAQEITELPERTAEVFPNFAGGFENVAETNSDSCYAADESSGLAENECRELSAFDDGGAENFCQQTKGRMRFSKQAAKRTKKYCLVVVGTLLLGAAVYGSVNGVDYLLHGEKAYAITVGDEEIATVDNYRTANSVIKDYLSGEDKAAKIKDAYFTEDVKITKVYEPKTEILDYDQARNKLKENATAVAECVTVKSDGVEVVNLSTEAEADTALQMLKDRYVPEDDTLKVTDVKFKENVEIIADTAELEDILSTDEAVQKMETLTAAKSYVYTVQEGDSLESVCESEGVAVEDMEKVSGEIDFEALQPGDQLKIDKEENLINVLTVMEKTKNQIISYDISYQENDEMPAGTQNVVQEGFDGAETVDLKIVRINGEELYRERLSAETTIPATTKIVDCGTKVYRANGETGKVNITSVNQMIWPTSATAISSPYGIRASGFHTGLDINGETGDSIWAALSGTVVTAGWCGNYGNCVVVKHSDGLMTRYAHLSAITVGVGENVNQGQVIGLEGSTGNSTGSHLHFEVIIGGTAVDPLLYISR